MTEEFRPCAVVPTYDNPMTVRRVVAALAAELPVVLVDDGSGDEGRAACASVAADGLATLVRHDRNEGKGAAVKDGFDKAAELGYTHAFQVDADAQHDLAQVRPFLRAGVGRPEALVLGYPVYDESAPTSRVVGRRITRFWVALELGDRRRIVDAMIGFRLYPLASARASRTRCDGMGFDIEIAVRMARAGVPIVNLPVGVRYPPAAEGGVSHFHAVHDNLRLCLVHSRLCIAGIFGALRRRLGGATS